jgi:two-component sensor histidine kinase
VFTHCTMMTTQRHHRPVNQETREHFYGRRRQSVPASREFTRAALADWGIKGQRADDIALCVTELATNALLHGVPPGRGFQLFLSYDRLDSYDAEGGRTLRVEVHDSGDGCPEVVRPEVVRPDGESGRGLVLVEARSDPGGGRGGVARPVGRRRA